MLRNLSLKNSVISSLFGISMLSSLVGCSNTTASASFFNAIASSDYSVVQLDTTQFEILNEYSDKVKYKNKNSCFIKDEENDIYVYAVENSLLGLNSKSTDTQIINGLNMFFIDDNIDVSTNGDSVQLKNDNYTKIIFEDLTILDKNTNIEYYGKLSIMDYGQNETFVLAYSSNKDAINLDYIVKSLKSKEDSGEILVVSEIPEEPIDSLKVSYDKLMEQESQTVIDIPVIEDETLELDTAAIFATKKMFNGDFFSLNGYYNLERIKTDATADMNYGTSYMYRNSDFLIGVDIINLNSVNDIHGEAKTNEEKINYIKNYYLEHGNIDLTTIYSEHEILDCYNISVTNGIIEEYLTQYGLKDCDYTFVPKTLYGSNEWILLDDFQGTITKTNFEKCNVSFAITIDSNSNAYMLAFVYSPNMKDFINDTLSNLTIKNVDTISLSDNQAQMYENIFSN